MLWLFSDGVIKQMLQEAAAFCDDPEVPTEHREDADAVRAALETECAKRGATWSVNKDGTFTWS